MTLTSSGKYGKLFLKLEGVDIPPEPAIAIGSLIKAIAQNKVNPNDSILLNLTGAGFERRKNDHKVYELRPTAVVKPKLSEKFLNQAILMMTT